MIKKISFWLPVFGFWLSTTASYGQDMKVIFSDAEKQTLLMLKEVDAAKSVWSQIQRNAKKPELVSPRTLDTAGNIVLVPAKDWTSGFFPGTIWFLYEFTGKEEWKTEASAFTAKIKNEQWNAGTHDMGFKIYCSFGNGYRLTGDTAYKRVIIQSARTLSKRFNPRVGCIRSWDHNRDKWEYPVIIDNMMNLELLFEATRLTGDSTFYKIAVSHALTTMKNHFRSDFSSYHVVDYDTITGKAIKHITHQGYNDESAWARGQAWGLYGYTMCFRETHDKRFLDQAENIARFILTNPNLPSDLVPFWDYNAPGIPNEPRDVSAAAVVASAFCELSLYAPKSNNYLTIAEKITESLTSKYRSVIGRNKGFILLHSTGSKPFNSEVDVPLNYADYYYLEALLRLKKLKENKPLFENNRNSSHPDVFLLDADVLASAKLKIKSGDKSAVAAYDKLLEAADKALTGRLYTAMNKTQIPPSGNKHDYMSLAPYFWPNPNTPDGLPYIRRDGEHNPDIKEVKDKGEMGNMERDVEVLSLAYYFSENSKYAERAVALIRTWFLDPATRMNPNVNYGQAVMGRSDGRGEGVLETRGFIRVIDAIGLIRESNAWTNEDQKNMQNWISDFLHWMQTSKIGKEEMDAGNNHGIWYDAQRLGYALFLGEKNLADEICKNALQRLDAQMDKNGSFPRELARTNSLGYSTFVMQAFFQTAILAEKTDVDMWKAVTPSGKSLEKGVQFLLPYLTKEKKWTGKQIKPYNYTDAVPLIHEASQKLHHPEYYNKILGTGLKSNETGWMKLISGLTD